MGFFKELSTRWKAESPSFFKKLRTFGVSLMAAGGSVVVPANVPGLHIPPFLTTIATYAITIGFTIGFVSQLTCKSTPDQTPKP